MSSLITSRRKLLSKRKQSFFDNKIPFCIYCTTFGLTDYETVKGSTYCRGYIVVSRSCNCEVTEHYFQTINYKRK